MTLEFVIVFASGSHVILSPLILSESSGHHHAFHLWSKQLNEWDVPLPDNAEKQLWRSAHGNREGEALNSYRGIKTILTFMHKEVYLFV